MTDSQKSTLPQRPTVLRTIFTAAFSLLAAGAFLKFDSTPPLGVWLTVLALGVAPFLVRVRSFGPQLISRAIWWQTALLGLLLVIKGGSRADEACLMALGSFGAIVLAGRAGLANYSPAFVPVAFRRTLTASLVLALADLQALLLYGTIFLEETPSSRVAEHVVPFFAAAALMGVSVFGLYRLKMWGLVACLISNVVVAVAAITGVFDLPDILIAGLATTAVLQLLLPIPIIGRMVRTQRLS